MITLQWPNMACFIKPIAKTNCTIRFYRMGEPARTFAKNPSFLFKRTLAGNVLFLCLFHLFLQDFRITKKPPSDGGIFNN
jgi:hypothetical protein